MSQYIRYPVAESLEYVPVPDSNEVSDGYHTFGELYEHRCRLFILLLMLYSRMVVTDGTSAAWKWRRNDKGEEWPGWFIGGLNTPYGQITYHLPDKYWDELPIPEGERNTDYDGHMAGDVLDRLLLMIRELA